MLYPALLNSSPVASCSDPAGMPSFKTLSDIIGLVNCPRGPARRRDLFLIDFRWVEYALAHHVEGSAVGRKPAEKTALVPLMTRRPADLVHFQEQRIGVAVVKNLLHLLYVAALFSLAP